MKRKDDLYPPILGRGGRGPVTHLDARAIPKAGIFQYKDSLVEELIPFLPPGPEGPEGPQGPVGPPGEDGREIELSVSDTHILWRYVGETSWKNLIAIDDIKGQDGEDGKPVVIRKTPTHIEWQYLGDVSWSPLVPLEEIKGEKGDDGITPTISPVTETWWLGPVDTGFPARGPKGDKGDDGRTPELRQGSDAIEWRYLGDIAWTPLVPLIDITGPQGPPGPNNAIRAGYSHMGGGVYQIIDGDDDFEQEVFPEGDGVRIKWKTNRTNPAVFVIPGRAENGKPMMSVLEEEVGSDSCLVTFETVDGPAYPTKFLVTVIGDEE